MQLGRGSFGLSSRSGSSSKRPADPYIVDRSVRHITGGQEVQFFEDQPPWTAREQYKEEEQDKTRQEATQYTHTHTHTQRHRKRERSWGT
ncbi:hypothetical protein V1478_010923 [Vespula squamosa]|uniref:Uncharacterized protein n=1 Tax=Vespula squamosa TaxID=30214 RepID=A0ABD2AFQ9_VESSQ